MNNTRHVLLVEDSIGDQLLIMEALNRTPNSVELHVTDKGEAALDFLYHRGIYEDSPAPSLIILDLNLPTKSGREVLQEIRTAESLKTLPVAVFTTTTNSDELTDIRELGASTVATKPADFDEFVTAVGRFLSLLN